MTKLVFAVAALLWSNAALAYLDPVTGSLVIQSVIAFVAGALVAIKAYWSRLKAFFAGRRAKREGNRTATAEPQKPDSQE